MPHIERPDYTRRRAIPPSLKLILLGAVIFGLVLRSCWYDKRETYYEITDIELTDQTMASVDVLFVVANKTRMQKEESVLIRLYTTRGDEIASRITAIDIPPRTQRRYRKIVERWARPLYEGEELSHATVEIYRPAILRN
ncbi:MAG: hypothetical protein K0B81_03950 [Candidatus Cloacimonetes bacterium]|nr:hypothetical protein [Candidatus Cloacimonadota bacterium]